MVVICDVKSDQERLGLICDAHAQRIMGNGVIIPPRDFEHLSRWDDRV
jgi:hypothetical protein